MTFDQFKTLTTQHDVPANLAPPLQALWYDARGDWEHAHQVAQDIPDSTGAWIHAYLHRKEGDLGNASYWYRRAGKPVATDSLDAEWTRIAEALIEVPGTRDP